MRWFSGTDRRGRSGQQPSSKIVMIETAHGPVPVELKYHEAARRYSLRQSASSNTIKLIIPQSGSEKGALDFARGQAGWLAKQARAVAPPRPFVDGSSFALRGQAHILRRRPGFRGAVRVLMDDNGGEAVIEVTAPEDHLARRTRDWLKKQARADLTTSVEAHAASLDIQPGRISVRDQSSRWGSCSSRGNLNFSWRLVLAPPGVLDYVAAHEVAHLIEMNHSSRFWDIVETLRPDMKTQRRWLRDNSAALHAVGREPHTGH